MSKHYVFKVKKIHKVIITEAAHNKLKINLLETACFLKHHHILTAWDIFWTIDIRDFDLRKLSSNRNFVNALSITFDTYNEFLSKNLERELYEKLKTFIHEIEKTSRYEK